MSSNYPISKDEKKKIIEKSRNKDQIKYTLEQDKKIRNVIGLS